MARLEARKATNSWWKSVCDDEPIPDPAKAMAGVESPKATTTPRAIRLRVVNLPMFQRVPSLDKKAL